MVKEYRYYTYKVTFKDLPKYFYYGRRKDLGKPYLGSPKTFKHFWDQFEPEVQILYWYRTAKEAQEAENSLIGHTWKQEWNGRRYSLNRNVGGLIDEEACRSGGERSKKEGRGIHDQDYRESEEYKKMLRGLVEGGKGIYNPTYKESQSYKDQKIEAGRIGGQKIKDKTSRKVKCVETGEVYASGKEAGRLTNIHPYGIRRSAKSGGRLSAGGYRWVHLD